MADEGKGKTDNQGRAMQAYVSLSVAFVCIVVGLPLWWKTTEVYRASLPYSDIAALTEEQTKYVVHVKVVFFDAELDHSTIAGLQENLSLALNQDKSSSSLLSMTYKVFARYADDQEKKAYETAKNIRELDRSLWGVGGEGMVEDYHFFMLSPGRELDAGSGVIGNRAGVYLSSRDIESAVRLMSKLVRDVFVRTEAVNRAYESAAGAILDQTDRDSMRTLRSEPAYDVTLTLLNVRPDLMDLRWNVREAVDAYLKPFLDTMSPFVQFDIKSQVLYYVDLPVRPSYDEEKKEFYLKHDDLPHLINPIERELVSFTSNRPHINFVVYASPAEHSPLYIRNQKGDRSSVNAFLSPRWGGMMVYNPDKPVNETRYPVRTRMEMKELMEVLVTQLRLLIGLESATPRLDPSIRDDARDERAVSFWELSYWLRKRSLENCGIATSALSSLSSLLATISNIVINDQIADEIFKAIEAVRRSRNALLGSRLSEALLSSKQALISAETAFFDQSLLELLYFPDDQKFAIYIPLFLPISLPVLISMFQAIKWIRANRAQTRKLKTS